LESNGEGGLTLAYSLTAACEWILLNERVIPRLGRATHRV